VIRKVLLPDESENIFAFRNFPSSVARVRRQYLLRAPSLIFSKFNAFDIFAGKTTLAGRCG
jgi:hypothetical protein